MDARDPIDVVADSDDLYGIATWEPRTLLDRIATGLYGGGAAALRATVILLALAILLSQIALGGLGVVFEDPFLLSLVALSALPAFALAAYIRYGGVSSEPLSLLVGTFVLAILFASFAAVGNTVAGRALGLGAGGSALLSIPFFYLVVGPVEETVKLLAVRLHAYRNDEFDKVVDGAVYGAFAGLGFATIENALYIGQQYLQTAQVAGPALLSATGTAVSRTFAGPGHVIYSGFAGYYLGLAKFNRGYAGPLVVKGLLVAALIHATYNSLVGIAPGVINVTIGAPRESFAGLVAFIAGYDLLFGLLLFRRVARYRSTYRRLLRGDTTIAPELTEFDG
jgi:RsiW-degrading membrane proteinase PrsW (M82 family)